MLVLNFSRLFFLLFYYFLKIDTYFGTSSSLYKEPASINIIKEDVLSHQWPRERDFFVSPIRHMRIEKKYSNECQACLLA